MTDSELVESTTFKIGSKVVCSKNSEETLTSLVGKLEREKKRLETYKVGSKDYNKSYMIIERLKEDIVERACMLFSSSAKREEIKVDVNKEENENG